MNIKMSKEEHIEKLLCELSKVFELTKARRLYLKGVIEYVWMLGEITQSRKNKGEKR